MYSLYLNRNLIKNFSEDVEDITDVIARTQDGTVDITIDEWQNWWTPLKGKKTKKNTFNINGTAKPQKGVVWGAPEPQYHFDTDEVRFLMA